MTSGDAFPGWATTAAYMCCYPRDPLQMGAHRYRLRRYAAALEMPAPIVFRDIVCSARNKRPELDRLLSLVADGVFSVVFLPAFQGRCGDARARSAREQLAGQDCRIVEVPVTWHCPTHLDAVDDPQ